MSKSRGRPLAQGEDEEMDEEAPGSSSESRTLARQDPDTRRQIRHEYRNLAESIRGKATTY